MMRRKNLVKRGFLATCAALVVLSAAFLGWCVRYGAIEGDRQSFLDSQWVVLCGVRRADMGIVQEAIELSGTEARWTSIDHDVATYVVPEQEYVRARRAIEAASTRNALQIEFGSNLKSLPMKDLAE